MMQNRALTVAIQAPSVARKDMSKPGVPSQEPMPPSRGRALAPAGMYIMPATIGVCHVQ